VKKLLKYLKPYARVITLIVVLVFCQAMVDLTLPDYMSDIVDTGIVQGDSVYILHIGVKMILIALVGAAAAVGVSLFSARVAAGYSRDLRDQVFSKVESFSLREFEQFSVASLITRTTNDIQQIQIVVVMLLRIVLMAPVLGIGGILKIVQTQPSMTWVLAVAVPLLVAVIAFLAVFTLPKFKIVQRLVDRLNLVSRENLSGLRVIRAFNTQSYQEGKFDQTNQELTRINIFINRMMSLMHPSMLLILNLTMVAVVWVGAGKIAAGSLEVGSMMAFIQYAMQIMMSFLMVAMIFIMLPRASVSAARISQVLECKNSVLDPEVPKEPRHDMAGQVEFRSVYFSYPDADVPVLKDISFIAHPGEITAIIGGTGSGKSSIVNLIPRFFDVTGGNLLVDGVDVREMAQKTLRQKIGYVPQKALLFSGTIADNLAYGAPEASEEDLWRAAAVAQAADFIGERDEGLAAHIAQGATNVSGGQKQRLSIARALAKKPEILIFDDSFSALDFKTESVLRRALQKEAAHTTMILVAQRISTIMEAQQIVVLDKGEIAGIGTHRQLLADCQVYREIAYSQLSQEELA